MLAAILRSRDAPGPAAPGMLSVHGSFLGRMAGVCSQPCPAGQG
ncbi:hypothetical protein HRUBRA_00736 [Pseudohaliea rubra DSM 19751]|uniref:Uncharacterized protein n=1 Tax=Pseudohaliea rubra DSM 19751 TaxID=1265313 RepID=A0A095VT94_9GAMM|nr:hypothetical protein HRUBRA_00736 [Pseudohaliea rubra DSM 19751]